MIENNWVYLFMSLLRGWEPKYKLTIVRKSELWIITYLTRLTLEVIDSCFFNWPVMAMDPDNIKTIRRNSVETWEWMDIVGFTWFHQLFNLEVCWIRVVYKYIKGWVHLFLGAFGWYVWLFKVVKKMLT